MTSLLDSAAATESGSRASGARQNLGSVFTQRWIVELILDVAEYTSERDLTRMRVVEPAVGSGAFLEVIVERLLAARRRHAEELCWADLGGCVRGWDIREDSVRTSRRVAVSALMRDGCPEDVAKDLARAWVRCGDFLLAQHEQGSADVVVGNPPYVRIEEIPSDLLAAYRRRCPAMGGRADLYIGFMERGMDQLRAGGRLAFICPDRWMRNQYGRRLREKIASAGFALDASLVLHDVRAFHDAVSAYPAVTVLRRGEQGSVALGSAGAGFDGPAAQGFARWARASERRDYGAPAVSGTRAPSWHATSASWPDGSPETLAWLEQLAGQFPVLEDQATGTRISIGVATGADAVYVTADDSFVESERLLPLAMASDIKTGHFAWGGNYLVNPWDELGLIDIQKWPRLHAYLSRNAGSVCGRAIAKKYPRSWYRTIDRVHLALSSRPKLLLQDMKSHIHPVLAPEGFYPHHNLYYVVSDEWDLEVLGGLLLSEVVERQVAAYCVKMRGNTLRFQAQYLRRVRVPTDGDIAEEDRAALKQAFRQRDRAAATGAALRVYGLDRLPR